MKLPTLYSRTSTGAIQTWTMEIVGNGYRSITGQTDGKKTEAAFAFAKPKNTGKKNARTAEEQALAEAQSQWKKHVERGYFEDISKIDDNMSYIEVMLAAEADKIIDDPDFDYSVGVIVQNKYNGVRCIAELKNGKVKLTSRGGKEWLSVPHINKSLEKFFADHPTAILDGELYNYDFRQELNELISIVRDQSPSEQTLADSEKIVKFYVYDGYGFKNMNEMIPYFKRKNFIDEEIEKYTYCCAVIDHIVKNRKELDALYESFLANGEEGAIIRFAKMPYEHKRSKYLLKYKPEDDSEGIIVAMHDAKGSWMNAAKKATLRWRGKEFDATFKGTRELAKARWLERDQWLGKTVTFYYTGLTGLGTPNFARISPSNCFRAE